MTQKFPEPTVGALVVGPDGRVFLMRSKKWSDNYALPGGHIEVGERMEDAVIREVKEETGLDVYDIHFICHQEFIFDDIFCEKRHFIFFDFACRTDSTTVELNDEAQSHVWVTVDEAESLLVDPYTRRVVHEYRTRFLSRDS